MRAAIVTVSTSRSRGGGEDESGARLDFPGSPRGIEQAGEEIAAALPPRCLTRSPCSASAQPRIGSGPRNGDARGADILGPPPAPVSIASGSPGRGRSEPPGPAGVEANFPAWGL